jgi:hypothetical protein
MKKQTARLEWPLIQKIASKIGLNAKHHRPNDPDHPEELNEMDDFRTMSSVIY